MAFSKNFVWGAATASYQVEGAAYEDGKGLSVWDMFCRKPEATWKGQTGDVACDQYHHVAEDAQLMKEMGLQAYRFSVSWPRVLPQGIGAVNPAGLDYYDRLVDELLKAGVTPYLTLFHWDFPYALYCQGGWLNPAVSDWFAEYTSVVARRLGDRVKHWMTQNEPQCYILLGHSMGIHAPGDRLQPAQIMQMIHHSHLAHGKSVLALRAAVSNATIGIAPVGRTFIPVSDDPRDVEAARRGMFHCVDPDNVEQSSWDNSLWMDPIFLGQYGPEIARHYAAWMPKIGPDDFKIIQQPLDFLGVNIYQGIPCRADEAGNPVLVEYPMGGPLTAFYWPLTPEALYWGPKLFAERYHVPVMITENGMANTDWVAMDGKVHDPQRIDYTRRYLLQLERAVNEGVDVRGYFHWSLMDNFEWAEASRQRFGLVHVDYETLKRTPKDSAAWYREVIQSQGARLHKD